MVDKVKIEQAVRLLLEGIGEDITREGLIDTPDRIARMCEEIYGGLGHEADQHLLKQFPVENNEIVLEKDITFYSMCEHHLMPFYGKAHLAYIPNGKVTGLSKLARTVEVYSRRPQIPGTAYCSDCRCFGAYSGSKRNYGNAGSGTYLYDHARNKKTRKQNNHYCNPWCVYRR